MNHEAAAAEAEALDRQTMSQVPGLEAVDGLLLDGLEFCRRAYQIHDQIQRSPEGGRELLHRATPRAKKLVEEILPLAAYLQTSYGPGLALRARWRGGNQTYDARVLCSGLRVERGQWPKAVHLEITTATHPNDYLLREHLIKEGGAFGPHKTTRIKGTRKTESKPAILKGSEPVDELVAWVRERVRSKSAKRYPSNTVLLVRCVPGLPLSDDEWWSVVRTVRHNQHPKRFREIVLYESQPGRVVTASSRRWK